MVLKDVVDHEFVVDGVEKVVWDSVSEYQLDLKVDVLTGCGGKNHRELEIFQARQGWWSRGRSLS